MVGAAVQWHRQPIGAVPYTPGVQPRNPFLPPWTAVCKWEPHAISQSFARSLMHSG